MNPRLWGSPSGCVEISPSSLVEPFHVQFSGTISWTEVFLPSSLGSPSQQGASMNSNYSSLWARAYSDSCKTEFCLWIIFYEAILGIQVEQEIHRNQIYKSIKNVSNSFSKFHIYIYANIQYLFSSFWLTSLCITGYKIHPPHYNWLKSVLFMVG